MSEGRGGLAGLALALGAAGLAAGLFAERRLVGRQVEGRAPDGEPLGLFRGHPHAVTADDGVELWAEIDEPRPGAEFADLTVVFSHGYSLNLDAFHFQRKGLGGSTRMVFWDQRGHGRSGRSPAERCTIAQLGHDLGAVLDQAAPTGPVVLVGHSMGGMTMMSLAEARPELLDRVVGACFLSTSAGGLREVALGVPRPMAGLLHAYGPRAVAALTRAPSYVDRRRQNGSDLDLLITRLYSYASPVPASVVDFTAEVLASTPIETVAAFMPEFGGHDRLTTLAAYDECEALVIVGDRDLLTPPEHSEAIVRRLPHAEHVVVPQSGHMLLMEHPDAVNEAIRDLLARAQRLHLARQGSGGRGA